MNVWLIKASNRGDQRGALAIYDPLPFTPVRAFIIHDALSDAVRGQHAHRTLTEALCAVSGSVTVALSNGQTQARYVLNHPSALLIVPPGHWIELSAFSPGATLLVLADEPYNEASCIRHYDEFIGAMAAA